MQMIRTKLRSHLIGRSSAKSTVRRRRRQALHTVPTTATATGRIVSRASVAPKAGRFLPADRRRTRSRLVKHRRQKPQREHDAAQTHDQEPPPPRPIDEVDADDGSQGVEAGRDEGEREGGLVGSEAGQLNDRRAVVHDGVDAHELLEHLESHACDEPSSHRLGL
ncbi:hypothetical protein ZIOFF_057514 [Zingiber officinale]|uniref:Uncharacterized protein n=1 Tax=Zingiber officinale TaxID=94328 RepID=A0A8J5F3F0_ZINOF|nr:hypothetical protein ZIOFF_057514 [Zingiber officinale]